MVIWLGHRSELLSHVPSITYTRDPTSPSVMIILSVLYSTGYMQSTISRIWAPSRLRMKSLSSIASFISFADLKCRNKHSLNCVVTEISVFAFVQTGPHLDITHSQEAKAFGSCFVSEVKKKGPCEFLHSRTLQRNNTVTWKEILEEQRNAKIRMIEKHSSQKQQNLPETRMLGIISFLLCFVSVSSCHMNTFLFVLYRYA